MPQSKEQPKHLTADYADGWRCPCLYPRHLRNPQLKGLFWSGSNHALPSKARKFEVEHFHRRADDIFAEFLVDEVVHDDSEKTFLTADYADCADKGRNTSDHHSCTHSGADTDVTCSFVIHIPACWSQENYPSTQKCRAGSGCLQASIPDLPRSHSSLFFVPLSTTSLQVEVRRSEPVAAITDRRYPASET